MVTLARDTATPITSWILPPEVVAQGEMAYTAGVASGYTPSTTPNARFQITEAADGTVVFASPLFALGQARVTPSTNLIKSSSAPQLQLRVDAWLNPAVLHTAARRIEAYSPRTRAVRTCHLQPSATSCVFTYNKVQPALTEAPSVFTMFVNSTLAVTYPVPSGVQQVWTASGI